MPRAEPVLHGLNRWTVKCLDLSRFCRFETDKKARCDDISSYINLSCVSKY